MISDVASLKLLRSAGTALPLVPDPVGALAHGLGLARPELVARWRALHDEGVIEGVWAEANVALEGASEVLAASGVLPEAVTRRWGALLPDGSGLESSLRLAGASGLRGGWASEQFARAGFPPAAGEADLLAPATERSFLVQERAPVPMMSDAEGAFADRYFTPQRLPLAQDFWEEVAALGGLPGGAMAREVVRQLLFRKVWRRFSLRLHPAVWQGAGLACWALADSAQAQQAAAALAAAGGVSEVAVRLPDAAWPFRLSALFLGRTPGSGEAAARRVAEQWGRPLGRWLDLRLQPLQPPPN